MHILDRAGYRLAVGGLSGGLVSLWLLFNHPFLQTVLLYTGLGVFIGSIVFEALYRGWTWLGERNRLFAAGYTMVAVFVFGGSIVGGLVGVDMLSGNEALISAECSMNNPAPAQNRVTGRCELVQRDCSSGRDIPWYYMDGCQSGQYADDLSCDAIVTWTCHHDMQHVRLPDRCLERSYGDGIQVENGTVSCDS